MKLMIDIKPVKVTGRKKADVLDTIARRWGGNFVIGGGPDTSYSARFVKGRTRDVMDGNFILYNMVKFRHKSDIGHGRRLRDAHWDAYVYVVPARLVKRVKQNARNFTLVVG